MSVKTFQVRSDNPSDDLVLNVFIYSHQSILHLNGCIKVSSHDPVFEANYYSNSKKLVTRINNSVSRKNDTKWIV